MVTIDEQSEQYQKGRCEAMKYRYSHADIQDIQKLLMSELTDEQWANYMQGLSSAVKDREDFNRE